MNKREQRRFINELVGNVKREILDKLPNLPKEWDGIELRWLISEEFQEIVFAGWHDKRDKRYQSYINERMIKGF